MNYVTMSQEPLAEAEAEGATTRTLLLIPNPPHHWEGCSDPCSSVHVGNAKFSGLIRAHRHSSAPETWGSAHNSVNTVIFFMITRIVNF